MNILEALVQTKNSIQAWVLSNLVTKADKEHEHEITEITGLSEAIAKPPALDSDGVLYFE